LKFPGKYGETKLNDAIHPKTIILTVFRPLRER
jgi:hypothetical protein